MSKAEENKPLVSVLMTAYNREQYIAEAIESVLASTFSNFELIVVDDGSTDKTVEIASYYLKDERVKIIVNETNLQQFQNRNKAAFLARGKYLKYVDSDDILYSHTLELMVNIMESHPDCALGFCHTHGNSKHPLPHCYTPKEIVYEHYFLGGILFTGPGGTILRKDIFDSLKGFDLFGMPSDNHLLLKFASSYPVISLPRDLTWWRIHQNQAFSSETDMVNMFNNLKWNLDILQSPHCPLKVEDRLKAIKNCRKIFFKNIVTKGFQHPFQIANMNRMLQQNDISLFKLIKDIL